MRTSAWRFVLAVGTLVGSIIGVGIFGLPYAIVKVGPWWAAAFFIGLTVVQMLQHLFFAEVAIACPEKLRLAGLGEKYLGRNAKAVAGTAAILGFWGSMLAYIVVGGIFLHILLSPLLGGSTFVYQLSWGAVAAVVLFFDLGVVARIGFSATVILLFTMAAMILRAAPQMHLANFVVPAMPDYVLPYGVILFSLSGLPAILELEDILEGDHTRYRGAVIVGTFVAAAFSAAFGFVVYGVSGAATTMDAISGLKPILGPGIAVLGAVVGFLAVTTSYFPTGANLRASFAYDYKCGHIVSWLLAAIVPVVLFLILTRDYVRIISFSGAVFGGISSVLVALLFITVAKRKLVTDHPLHLPVAFAYGTIAVLTTGAIAEIVVNVMRARV